MHVTQCLMHWDEWGDLDKLNCSCFIADTLLPNTQTLHKYKHTINRDDNNSVFKPVGRVYTTPWGIVQSVNSSGEAYIN